MLKSAHESMNRLFEFNLIKFIYIKYNNVDFLVNSEFLLSQSYQRTKCDFRWVEWTNKW